MVRAIALVAIALLSTLPARAFAQRGSAPVLQCAPLATPLIAAIDSGWAALRRNDLARAESLFGRVLTSCPREGAAGVGGGYVALRRDRLALAARLFDIALAARPLDHDALMGAGMAAFRQGATERSRALFTRALAIAPGDSVSQGYLAKLPVRIDARDLPTRTRPETLQLAARTGRRIIEVPDGAGGWRPLWIKALNIGAALPGRHASEFPPDDSTYERWIAMADSMGVNTLRVYTIHPPHFYRALRDWNLAHASRPMRLITGVWTELPPGKQEERYDDPAWRGAYLAEMRRVVDLIHGHAAIPLRPGHAAGLYTADVSAWTIGYILGREWEPYSVVAYSRLHPRRTSYAGTYISMAGGNAVDAWMAEFSDSVATYEMRRYNAQRPMAYTNWPTLDPLRHPTETTRGEETALLTARGETVVEASREYDNDAIALDATKVRATAAFPAGVFASFHAYPYYPDFLLVDPGYAAARSPEGPSHYFGYLRELVAYHGDMPVVISEYGVPSSRGNAHVQPQGWDHGGHSDSAQARIDARLTRDIHAAGAAGVGLFAIIDEWFKKNWLVVDFEAPLERKRLWYNALDAEENYGVIAMRPGARDSAMTIDGRGADWHDATPLYTGHSADAAVTGALPAPLQLRALHVRSDEGYVYLRLDVGAIDWARARYSIGIDTYGAGLGDTRLPYTRTRSPVGLEFVLDLQGPGHARLLVDQRYDPYRTVPIQGSSPPARQRVYNTPFRTVPNDDGTYDTLMVTTNRRRLGRDGTLYPELAHDRNALLFATQTATSLADWYADSATGIIEIRLPWGMLQVTDPSTRSVLYAASGGHDPESAVTSGFLFVVESYDPRAALGGGDRLPRATDSTAVTPFGAPPLWTWAPWEVPQWHEERKPLFDAMRATFLAIPDDGSRR